MSQNEGTGHGAPPKAPGGRPGAMTMAMQAVNTKPLGPKVLRIGVIQGGKIVQERIVRKRETVTVGSSEHNHFVLSAAGGAPRFELFQLIGNDYILNFTESMSGRVGLPAGVQTLEQLRSSGAARNAGTHWQVKLNDNSRGKVVIGDVTLLFQFVTAPPVQPRPQLPAAARGGLAKSVDWMFTAFVLFSFMGHFGLVVYLENTDWPLEQGLGVIPKQYIPLVMIEEPEPEKAPTIDDGHTQDTVAEPTPAPSKPVEKPRGESDQARPGNQKDSAGDVGKVADRIAEEAGNAAEAMLLGALSVDQGGALKNVLAGGAIMGNAADILAEAEGVGIANGAAGAVKMRSGSGNGGRVGDLGRLVSAGGSGTIGDGNGPVEGPLRGTFKPMTGDTIGGSGDFDPKFVIAMIRQRQAAIKACYEHRLRANSALEGKLAVQFTIEESGTISKPSVTENSTNDAELAACVLGVIKNFRFNPGPAGGSVMFSFPFVFSRQN
ncbi:MAG: AgmX/PglI C-terminal domain-containing protein [Myxococcales bacterium]